MHTERILPEVSYLSEAMPRLYAFFLEVLLPLLLTDHTEIGGECTQVTGIATSTNCTTRVRSHSFNDTSSPSWQVTTYCWCGGQHVGRMIACDNPNVVWNGFTLSELVLPVNLKASGFALTFVKNILSNFK